MNLRILGCSGGIGGELRTTSLMVDHDILIDAGTGLGNLTLDEMKGLRHIFLTHSHLDHIAHLPLLVDSIFEHIRQPIVIHAQEVTIKALREHIFNWVIWPDFTRLPDAQNPVLTYEAMSPGDVVAIDGRSFEMIPVNHAVPAVGYYVRTPGGKSFAFSGDTTTNDTFWAGLNQRDRLDMLIIEVAFPDSELELSRAAYHYCPTLLAQDIVKLRHQPDIYLSHPKPGVERIIEREVSVAIRQRKVTCLKGKENFTL